MSGFHRTEDGAEPLENNTALQHEIYARSDEIGRSVAARRLLPGTHNQHGSAAKVQLRERN